MGMFACQTNKYALFDRRDVVFKAIEPIFSTTNKHTKTALCTILLNMSIVLHEAGEPPKSWDTVNGALIAKLAMDFLGRASPDDNDAKQRACLAIGSLIPRDRTQNGGAVTEQLKQAGLSMKLIDLERSVGSNYASELRRLLS